MIFVGLIPTADNVAVVASHCDIILAYTLGGGDWIELVLIIAIPLVNLVDV